MNISYEIYIHVHIYTYLCMYIDYVYKYMNMFYTYYLTMIIRAFCCYQLQAKKHLITLLTLISRIFFRESRWDSIDFLN